MIENREFIDDLFKNKLSQQDFEAPQDFIFDIQKRIEKKRNRRKLILFCSFIFGSLSIFILCYFILNSASDHNILISNQKVEKNKSEKSKSTGIQKIGFKKVASCGIEISVNTNYVNHRNNSVDKNSNVYGTKSIQRNFSENKEKISLKNDNQNYKLSNQPFDKENTSKYYYDSNRIHSDESDIKNEEHPTTVSSGTDAITESNYSAKSDSIFDTSKRKNEDLSTDKEITKSHSKNRYEIQAFFGPKVNLMDRNSVMKMNSLGVLKGPSISFSFGLNNQIIRKNFVFGTGIQYTEWKENYNWSQLNKFLIDSINLNLHLAIPNLFDTTGTNFYPINITNMYYLFKDSVVKYKLENSMSFIQVPLYFGYCFQLKTIEIIPKLGLNFMFSKVNQTVEIPTYHVDEVNGFSQPLTPFTSFQTNQFLMSYQLEIEIKKRLNQWYIYASPYYGNGINSMIQTTEKKHPSNFGCNIGIGICF
jgi:hypothetical protein